MMKLNAQSYTHRGRKIVRGQDRYVDSVRSPSWIVRGDYGADSIGGHSCWPTPTAARRAIDKKDGAR